jgi:hypothetical protein
MNLPRVSVPSIGRTGWLVVGVLLVLLLLVPLAFSALSSARPVASRNPAAKHSPSPAASQPAPGTPQSVAIAGVEAKTGLKYSSNCGSNSACLSITGQTVGQSAAAILFSTAKTGGRECVGYVVQKGAAWQLLSAICGLPNQLAPLVGHDATVHVPGNCANAHDRASIQGGVVACLYDGTGVHVDGGPSYADGFVWWHTSKGWVAHDFLVTPAS